MSTKSEIQISLDGVLSIQNAQKIKSTLLQEAANSENVIIVCQNPTNLDLSVLQLLIAAQKKSDSGWKKNVVSFSITSLSPINHY